MSRQQIILSICVLAGVMIFSFVKAIDLFWDKNALNDQIEDSLKPRIAALESENNRVNNDLDRVKKDLSQTKNSLLTMEEENSVLQEELKLERIDLRKAQMTIENKDGELTKIKTSYNEVDSENKLLKEKFNAMYIEFLEMKKTLSSLESLRQAIKDLKTSSKKNRRIASSAETSKAATRVANKTKDTNPKSVLDTEMYGNSGYLIKDGQSTFPKVHIKVVPVE